MDDPTIRHEFRYGDRIYRIVHRGGRWLVLDGDVETTGPSLVDAMEGVFGPLYDEYLLRVALRVLDEQSQRPPSN
jgi:hypothetical protein